MKIRYFICGGIEESFKNNNVFFTSESSKEGEKYWYNLKKFVKHNIDDELCVLQKDLLTEISEHEIFTMSLVV